MSKAELMAICDELDAERKECEAQEARESEVSDNDK
jgi:hypothetical protein